MCCRMFNNLPDHEMPASKCLQTLSNAPGLTTTAMNASSQLTLSGGGRLSPHMSQLGSISFIPDLCWLSLSPCPKHFLPSSHLFLPEGPAHFTNHFRATRRLELRVQRQLRALALGWTFLPLLCVVLKPLILMTIFQVCRQNKGYKSRDPPL